MADPVSDAAARSRWLVINAVRLAGVAMVLIGLLTVEGRIDLPRWAGYVLLALGIADVFLMPIVLARRWRSPDR